MPCAGCGARAGLIGDGLRAARRGAWEEAAQAAVAVASSARADLGRLAGKVAQAAASVRRGGR